MKSRLIIDASSVMWTSLMQGTDKEFGRKVEHKGRQFQVNSAAYGYEGAVDLITHALGTFGIQPKDIILCVEGMNSKGLRRAMFPDYKKDSEGDKPEDSYIEFRKLRDMLTRTFLDLGAQAISRDGVEGDDLVTWCCKYLDGIKYVLSNDRDMDATRVYPNVHVFRNGRLDENGYGPFDPKYIRLFKALVGGKDGLPGAKGFGEKAWLDTLCIFGNDGLEALNEVVHKRRIDTLKEDVHELKALQKIIDNKDTVYKCWDAAGLYPDHVNTLRAPMTWSVGMVKPLTKDTDERLKNFAGRRRLVGAHNYEATVNAIATILAQTEEVGLDIETSTPPESDEWLAMLKGLEQDDAADLGVDVLGSKMTGLGLTIGANNQYTFYFNVDHKDVESNRVTSAQVLRVIKMIPKGLPIVVHNAGFELPVLKKEWGSDEVWQSNGCRGFLPNVHDTVIMASYVNENERRGLKDLAKRLIGYEQQTYEQTTCWVRAFNERKVPDLKKDGSPKLDSEGQPKMRIEREPIGEMMLKDLPEGAGYEILKRFKMNEIEGAEVFSYGADDPIVTLALYNHFRTIMEAEKTWEVFLEVEIDPAYLTADAFVKGTKFSLERMLELEKEDAKIYDENWAILREYLFEKGWEGTVCPVATEMTPAAIKEAFLIITGEELETRVRLPEKMAAEIDALGYDLLADFVRKGDIESMNALVRSKFKGEPVLDFDSPKKMQKFLYRTLGLPVAILNNLTDKEREHNQPLAEAHYKFSRIFRGSESTEPMTPEELELLISKATTDDDAVNWLLEFNADEEQSKILKAVQAVKTVMTRRKLFYNTYRNIRHWIDGKIHAQLKQCAAVTRRYSASTPNLQQLPKKGEGVKFRETYVPHKPGAVICSIDFSGQELRLMAGQSLDKNMMDCYVGPKLKDIHSITATGIAMKKWDDFGALAMKYGGDMLKSDPDFDYDVFMCLRKAPETSKRANDTRKDAKNVNFAAQFDCMAPKLATMLTVPLQDAQLFLDAKKERFPRVEEWKDEVRDELVRTGYVTTMMGARRHLGHVVISANKWEVERAGRQGPNFKIQGSAAEQTKLAMGRVWKSDILDRLDMVFIAPIHDELVWSVVPKDLFESIRVIQDSMTKPYSTLPVPIVGSISFGPNFGVQVEVGEVADKVSITNAFRKWAEDPENEKHAKWVKGVLEGLAA